MWRLAASSVARSRTSIRNHILRGSASSWLVDDLTDQNNLVLRYHPPGRSAASAGSVRYFARRPPKDLLDDPNEELLEQQESNASKSSEGTLAAWDMEFFGDPGFDEDEEDEEELAARLDDEYRRKQEEIQKELDSRTGRPWKDPWEITEEQWMSTTTADDLPDWSPEHVSRISQERVKIHPDGIPTLATLASTPLPRPASPHPGLGEAKAYAKYRKQMHYQHVAEKVREVAKKRVEKIMEISNWNEKQDAVDELFETVVLELKVKEDILGKHPEFGKWVERGLEEYLQTMNKKDKEDTQSTKQNDEASDQEAVPLFMDCYNAEEGEKVIVPSILNPLQPHRHDGPGRMVEEWQISAHKKTKRILLRECTRSIARVLEGNESSRIFVHGRRGVGKSAVLASVVASARKSGHIVLYLPDGDRLRKNGFFITPNAQREGMFDLPDLSQEACDQLISNHADDLADMEADKATMEFYFKDTQLKRIPDYSGESMSLLDLLKYAQERKNHAPMCYSVVVDRLMKQDQKPFLMVMDEFNCYYDYGHYFHMAHDEDVRDPIPYENINLFEHAMAAMALSAGDEEEEDEDSSATPKVMKRGAIIVGTTESHAVRRRVTDSLTRSAQKQNKDDSMVHVVDVPRFSSVEVEHILANYECIGLGKLRLDRGDTVMNDQEVAYLKMASGCVGQKLLDISVL